MNKRIRSVRKVLHLSQNDFGKKIGLGQAGVSFIEQAGNTVTEQNIKSICSAYNVNEDWLRTGRGDMWAAPAQEDIISQLVQKYNLDYIGEELLRTYCASPPEVKAAVTRFVMQLTANIQKAEDRLQADADSPPSAAPANPHAV